MSEGKWVRFEEDTPPAWRTRFWRVKSKQGGSYLGCIKWWGGWRRYCFFPEQATIFEQDCLRDIANFCEAHTSARKAERQHEREEMGALAKN